MGVGHKKFRGLVNNDNVVLMITMCFDTQKCRRALNTRQESPNTGRMGDKGYGSYHLPAFANIYPVPAYSFFLLTSIEPHVLFDNRHAVRGKKCTTLVVCVSWEYFRVGTIKPCQRQAEIFWRNTNCVNRKYQRLFGEGVKCGNSSTGVFHLFGTTVSQNCISVHSKANSSASRQVSVNRDISPLKYSVQSR